MKALKSSSSAVVEACTIEMMFLASASKSNALMVSTISGIEICPLPSASNRSKTSFNFRMASVFMFLLVYFEGSKPAFAGTLLVAAVVGFGGIENIFLQIKYKLNQFSLPLNWISIRNWLSQQQIEMPLDLAGKKQAKELPVMGFEI